jgi:hypothetical protein
MGQALIPHLDRDFLATVDALKDATTEVVIVEVIARRATDTQRGHLEDHGPAFH